MTELLNAIKEEKDNRRLSYLLGILIDQLYPRSEKQRILFPVNQVLHFFVFFWGLVNFAEARQITDFIRTFIPFLPSFEFSLITALMWLLNLLIIPSVVTGVLSSILGIFYRAEKIECKIEEWTPLPDADESEIKVQLKQAYKLAGDNFYFCFGCILSILFCIAFLIIVKVGFFGSIVVIAVSVGQLIVNVFNIAMFVLKCDNAQSTMTKLLENK